MYGVSDDDGVAYYAEILAREGVADGGAGAAYANVHSAKFGPGEIRPWRNSWSAPRQTP